MLCRPALDQWGDAAHVAQLRQLMECARPPRTRRHRASVRRVHCASRYGHVFEPTTAGGGGPKRRKVRGLTFLAAMDPAVGAGEVNPRLQRLFATFAVVAPSAAALTSICTALLQRHLGGGDGEAGELSAVGQRLVRAAVRLHTQAATRFARTAAHFHYSVDLRTLAHVFDGLRLATPADCRDPETLARLWLHEAERAYADRLVGSRDAVRRTLAPRPSLPHSHERMRSFSPRR